MKPLNLKYKERQLTPSGQGPSGGLYKERNPITPLQTRGLWITPHQDSPPNLHPRQPIRRGFRSLFTADPGINGAIAHAKLSSNRPD